MHIFPKVLNRVTTVANVDHGYSCCKTVGPPRTTETSSTELVNMIFLCNTNSVLRVPVIGYVYVESDAKSFQKTSVKII